jgi:DNA-binding transcriptional LysR family regulator
LPDPGHEAGRRRGLLPAILAEYGSWPGAIPVDIVFSVGERAAMLLDGRADVGLLHSPQNNLDGLDAEELRTERQVVVLPEGHQPARQATVRMAELHNETMPRWPEVADFVRAASTAAAHHR